MGVIGFCLAAMNYLLVLFVFGKHGTADNRIIFVLVFVAALLTAWSLAVSMTTHWANGLLIPGYIFNALGVAILLLNPSHAFNYSLLLGATLLLPAYAMLGFGKQNKRSS